MKLSIIIPVYNAINTLMRCVDSIVLQPVDQMEMILVDDGSTDGSGALCDNIKRQYEGEGLEIMVLHKENGGLSSARNAGIAASTGELLTFVDADDYIGKNTYSKQMEFFECAEDVDVVEFPVAKFYNDFLKKEVLNFTVDFYDDTIEYLYNTEAFRHSYAWNKVYRRRVFLETLDTRTSGHQTNAIPEIFPLGKAFEDIATMPQWLSRTRRIVTSDGGMYFYTLNPQGICHTAGEKEFGDHLEALINLLNWIPDSRRKGVAYVKLLAQTLNVRKDYQHSQTSPKQIDIPTNLHLRWSDILSAVSQGLRKPELLKLLAYKLCK